MPKYWKQEQIDLLLDLFRKSPPAIDPENIPSGHDLRKFIEDYKAFNIFKDHERVFYQGIRRYAAQFKIDQALEIKDKRKGKNILIVLFYFITHYFLHI